MANLQDDGSGIYSVENDFLEYTEFLNSCEHNSEQRSLSYHRYRSCALIYGYK